MLLNFRVRIGTGVSATVEKANPNLDSSGESITSKRDEKQDLADTDVVEDVEVGVGLGLLVGLRGGRLVLVHEEGDADDDEQDEEVLQKRVPLSAEEDAQHHDRDGLAGLTDHLKTDTM